MFSEWEHNQPVEMTCIEKWAETGDCVSIKLAHASLARFSFKPGQFVTLGVSIDGQSEFRAYSISSQPDEAYIQLTVKRVSNGKVSTFIVDQLEVGHSVQVMKPSGAFNCLDLAPRPSEDGIAKVLLISAGCGITPVYTMVQYWINQSHPVDIEFLHVAKSAAHTIYFDQLATLDEQYAQFHLRLLLKDATGTPYPQGRLTSDWLMQRVPDLQDRQVYLCGPEHFMCDVKQWLEQAQFDMAAFHQESFTPAATPEAISETVHTEVEIEVPAFARRLTAQHGAVLADVLEQAGLPVIVACRSGICGSCKCKVTRGSVNTFSHEALTEQEVAQGYILACSSTLSENIGVDIG
ncbi:hybrid-cluster NAD(P)-dependent oxidoreductase [Vibrio sp. V39_P1S14PM300]|uniref:hybrid-cluster NAD(P)-dependent oxidoreductase n=1 Tax=Vibrio sp. V39_P1S14PM300 TaxID=1938690 RepID=UPI001373550B|nr:hybrid-cluster NAD(P)-dependent oxidoreductase [Vibrio sp. V39_P1S14PM300]NAX20130.1 2Fe-2S iron-sulfur cluster binding domain-containing protein [Vibrio sp. V39_P1S14PM300]